MNLRVPRKGGDFLTRKTTISLESVAKQGGQSPIAMETANLTSTFKLNNKVAEVSLRAPRNQCESGGGQCHDEFTRNE